MCQHRCFYRRQMKLLWVFLGPRKTAKGPRKARREGGFEVKKYWTTPMWCPTNGSRTPPRLASLQTTAADLTLLGGAICCDATLVSPLRRDGSSHAGAPFRDGAVLQMAQWRKRTTYPELAGRWNASAMSLVRRLVALRACPAPPAVRSPARAAWAKRWWSVPSTAVQQALGQTAFGRTRAVPGPSQDRVPALDEVIALAPADFLSGVPLC